MRHIPTLLLLTLALAMPLAAQEPATTATTTSETTGTAATTTTTTTSEEPSEKAPAPIPEEVRSTFTTLLQQSPPELVTILNADRTLLSDDAFMSRYPEVASFIAKYPEIRRNPRFYLLEFEPRPHYTPFDQIVEMVSVGFLFLVIVTASAWLIRTVIEQRRWSRMSKLQAEVHAKILDRFASSSEVLEYIKSPAGTKFLEAAPIPLQAESRTRMTPLTRVAWTIQLGVVIAAAGLGMLLVSLRLAGEGSDGMYSLGMIAFCLGAGFIASAAVSVFVSRRLGILQAPPEEVDAQ